MKLPNFILRIPRSFLWRIEMRVRHVLETWSPLQTLFAQVRLLDRRTDLIEHRIVDLAALVQRTNDQLTELSQTLAHLQRTLGEGHAGLQMQLAPLEARLVRMGMDIVAVRAGHDDGLGRMSELSAKLGAVNEGIGARFNSVGARLDDLGTALQPLVGTGARFDSIGVRFDDLATGLRPLAGLSGRFDNIGVRLDHLAVALTAIPEIGARFDSVGARFDDLAAVLRLARDENSQIGVNVSRQVDGIKVRFDDFSTHLNAIETVASAILSRQHVPLADEFDAVHTPKGWMVVPREEFRSLVHLADGSAYHEPGTLHVIETLLKPGDVVIDVGAHIGLITTPMARKVGPEGRVLSLEPFPRSAEALRRSVALNGVADQVSLHVNAAAETAKTAQLFTGATGMMASLYPDEPSQPSITVETVRLDDLVAPGGRVDLVKIDAEGAELAVLRGMRRIIAENEQVLVIAELGPSHLVRTGGTVQAWLATFEDLGFAAAFEIDDEALGLRPLRSAKQLEAVYSLNLLFARDANDERLAALLKRSRAPASKRLK